jgi:hypothetical protein
MQMRFHLYDNKQLNFVELNSTGTNTQYVKCDPESKYLDSVVFNLFSERFEKANSLYEYYGPTKYNARYIVPLRNQLLTNLTYLEKVTSLAEFQSYISEKVLGKEFLLALVRMDKNWSGRWMVYHEKLVVLNKELLDLVDFCIDEDRILWVVGY